MFLSLYGNALLLLYCCTSIEAFADCDQNVYPKICEDSSDGLIGFCCDKVDYTYYTNCCYYNPEFWTLWSFWLGLGICILILVGICGCLACIIYRRRPPVKSSQTEQSELAVIASTQQTAASMQDAQTKAITVEDLPPSYHEIRLDDAEATYVKCPIYEESHDI